MQSEEDREALLNHRAEEARQFDFDELVSILRSRIVRNTGIERIEIDQSGYADDHGEALQYLNFGCEPLLNFIADLLNADRETLARDFALNAELAFEEPVPEGRKSINFTLRTIWHHLIFVAGLDEIEDQAAFQRQLLLELRKLMDHDYQERLMVRSKVHGVLKPEWFEMFPRQRQFGANNLSALYQEWLESQQGDEEFWGSAASATKVFQGRMTMSFDLRYPSLINQVLSDCAPTSIRHVMTALGFVDERQIITGNSSYESWVGPPDDNIINVFLAGFRARLENLLAPIRGGMQNAIMAAAMQNLKLERNHEAEAQLVRDIYFVIQIVANNNNRVIVQVVKIFVFRPGLQ